VSEAHQLEPEVKPGLDVAYVPPHLLDPVWPRAGALLMKGLEFAGGRYEIEDVYREIIQYQQHLWIVFDTSSREIIAAATTKILEYPRRRLLSGVFLGGERLDEWADLYLDVLAKFEKDMGCDGLEFIGRHGWTRALKHRMKAVSVIYERI
jgi:hypothetical protein